ncbi:hypothetical protein B1R32_11274 [Abditibacterium utsteinense]|uniref:Uncharacterized protein n=1 Tax=Abditibacterium utsteinense TaxID=1960156 RepID=A0A2S8SRP2_9BACT|nr:tetratricopeptide repeat protein [Abditibacterium utsteinense]PQV63419.1 hypothetical protein B1R32_11274 [Abditibacterium utsteinense]
MARLICGRCGQQTASNSTYCARDQWVLLADLPGEISPGGALFGFETSHPAGFIARRAQESARDKTRRSYLSKTEKRLEALEKRLEAEPENPEVHRQMALLAMLEGQNERANAFYERAHALDKEDLETHVNYAIVLARRGQLQPALNLLEAARQKWPNAPLILFNLALVALQARRASQVHLAVDALEKMWLDNPALAPEFHDESVTARGLAFLLQEKPREASTQLEAAARHRVSLPGESDSASNSSPADELQLAGVASADALNNLALAEAEMGEMDRAIARFQAARRLEPGHPQVLANLGVVAYRQGRLDVAWKYLDTARHVEEELEAPEATTLNHLGVVASALGRLDESLELFQRAGGTEHAEFEVYYNLGRAYIEHAKPDLGVQALRQSFTIDPNNADVHTVLGAAYLLRGRSQFYAEALKHLKRALQLDAHHRTATTNLALGLIEIRNLEMSQKMLAQELEISPGDAPAQFLSGLLTLETATGKRTAENIWVSAAQSFDGAFGARPDVTAALYNSALCQFMMGFRDTSAKLLESATGRDPSLGPAYYLIGFGHAVAKREAEALKAWHIAVKFEPANPDLHANMAALFYRKGDFEASSRAYLKAHQLLPGDPLILAALGVAFAQRKMYHQAITALEQSIALDPTSPKSHSNLGLAYYLFKQVEKALENWRMVSRLDSAYAASREEEQQRSFDDSIVQLRPINWRTRVVKMAPVLPRPHTRLLPGPSARAYRFAITDPALQEIAAQKREVERLNRALAWMHLKI